MMCPWVTKGTGFVKYVLQNVEKRHEMLVYLTRDYIIETREINLRTNMCHLRALGLQNLYSKVWRNNVFEVPEAQRGRSF